MATKRPTDFKILSIDGGGMKGLFSAKIIEIIEETYGPVAEHFDLICGTSTGGLIALALAAGKSGKEISEFYESEGPKIFKKFYGPLSIFNGVRQFSIWSKYTDRELKRALTATLGDKKLDDSKVRLCIPTINLQDSKLVVLKTCHDPELQRDRHVSMVDAALATSAAPTYLPVAKIPKIGSYLADGGLIANNPVLIGVSEALRYFVGKKKSYRTMSVLSLGNLQFSTGWGSWKWRRAGLLPWGLSLMENVINAQVEAASDTVRIAYENNSWPMSRYTRLEHKVSDSNTKRLAALDATKKKSFSRFTELANSKRSEINSKDIAHFFKAKAINPNFNKTPKGGK